MICITAFSFDLFADNPVFFINKVISPDPTFLSFQDSTQYRFQNYYPYEDKYQNGALYVHELINYIFHPEWQFDWERQLFSSNELRVSAGSVRTDELLVNTQLYLNNDLSKGWWFHTRGNWYSSRHRNSRTLDAYLGLEKYIYKNFSVFALGFPRFDKEYLSAQFGLGLYSDTRENYLNIALVLKDMVWDGKNPADGRSTQKPLGIQWYIRHNFGKTVLFSEGNYDRGFKRYYPDPVMSPVDKSHNQQTHHQEVKLYYLSSPTAMLQFQYYHYFFDESKTFYGIPAQFDYGYRNELNHFSLLYMFTLREHHRLRLIGQYMVQNAGGTGFSVHDFHREDFMPALFYEYLWIRHILEVGYMFSLHNWEYDNLNDELDYQLSQGKFDKLYIGYTYRFTDSARLHLSVSHQPIIEGFGGGSVQYIMYF